MAPDDRGVQERGFDVRPELLAQFPDHFAAALALFDFCQDNRPTGPPTPDLVGHLLLWMYARSTKSYAASLRLSAAGFGEQASMVNRALFEETLLAHWAKRHPSEALELMNDHEAYTNEAWRRAVVKHGLGWKTSDPLDGSEWKRLKARFGSKTWAAKSLYELADDVVHEWPDAVDKRLLWQQYDIVNRHNNVLLHQTAHGLRLAGKVTAEGVAFLAGPSSTAIKHALVGAFLPYANTASLVYQGAPLARLNDLFAEHLRPFVQVREEVEPPRTE